MSIQFPRIEPWPGISQEEWTNWKWQSKSALVSRSDFEKHFELSASESQAFESGAELFRVRSTPYYASLAMGRPQDDPIRKILLPSSDELSPGLQQMSAISSDRCHHSVGQPENQPLKLFAA